MKPVVTRASTVRCQHGGTVLTSGAKERWIYVNGASVMCNSDPVGLGILGCPTPTSGGCATCVATTTVETGESTLVFVDGAPVLLEPLTGSTNGMAPGPRRDARLSPFQQYAVDSVNQVLVKVAQ
jgi:hypothetical protein